MFRIPSQNATNSQHGHVMMLRAPHAYPQVRHWRGHNDLRSFMPWLAFVPVTIVQREFVIPVLHASVHQNSDRKISDVSSVCVKCTDIGRICTECDTHTESVTKVTASVQQFFLQIILIVKRFFLCWNLPIYNYVSAYFDGNFKSAMYGMRMMQTTHPSIITHGVYTLSFSAYRPWPTYIYTEIVLYTE